MIDAPYGHDCFLLEEARQTPMIQRVSRPAAALRADTGDCGQRGDRTSAATEEHAARVRIRHPRRCTPASVPTRTPARAPCRSSRPPATCSRIPESAAAYFNLQEYGNTYSRIMNPTVAVFEERMANLEGGCGAVAFASGIAAQAAALFTLLQPGDHVVSSSALYGGTVNQFKHLLRKMSVEPDLGRSRRSGRMAGGGPRQHEGVLRRDHRQPRRQRARHRDGRRHRPRARAAADRRQHLRHAVPLPADRVGRRHRRPLGDQVHRRPRHEHRRRRGGVGRSSTGRTAASRSIADPSPAYHGLQFHETFGTYGYLMKLRAETLRDLGAAMSPFNAFLFLQGLETLSLRMARHVENAAPWRSYLDVARAGVERHATRACPTAATGRWWTSTCRAAPARSSPSTAAAGATAGQDFIRGVTLWSHLANVGDSKSLIIHPASTTHRQLNDDELRAAGVGPGTIRLSVGTESIDDLIWDLEQGFARRRAAARGRRGRRMTAVDRSLDPVRSDALSGSADDPARAPQREDHRHRRAVDERAARQLLRRLLPQAARLPRHPGESARDRDPGREELHEPRSTCPVPVDIVNVFRAPGRAAGDRRRGRDRSAPASLWCQFGGRSTRKARASPRRAVSRS